MAVESPETPAARSTAMTSVWWDTKSCPVPVGCDPRAVVGNICADLDGAGYRGPVSFFVFGDAQMTPRPVANALKSSGVVIRHVPAGNKDRCDKKILVEMLIWAFDNPPPANFLLITGDDELSNVLQSLRLRNYDTLLVQPRYTSRSCTKCRYKSQPCNSAQNCMWLWEGLASGGPASLSDGSDAGFEGGGMSRRSVISMQNKSRKRQCDRGGEVQMCNSRKRMKPAINFSKRQNENETNKAEDRANFIQEMDQDRHQVKLMHEIDFVRYQDKHAVQLVEEINLNNNGKPSVEYEMVQDMDISDEDEVEQKNDAKQKDGGQYVPNVLVGMQQVDEKELRNEKGLAMEQEDERKLTRSLEEVKGELEKGKLKGVNEPPGEAEDLMKYKNGSLHMENEVSKTELMQNDVGAKVQSFQRNAIRRRLRKERKRAALNLIKRQKENETNWEKDRAKVNQEIDIKINQDKHQMKLTMLEMEQKDESLEKVKGEFEKKDVMIVGNEPGQSEGLIKYENGLLHIEDEVSKTELVQNVTDCLNDLKQSVDGNLLEKEMNLVKDELKLIVEMEKIEDGMEPKKDPSQIEREFPVVHQEDKAERECQVVHQEDKAAQIHVEKSRDELQMDNEVKTIGTVQEKKKKKKNRKGKVETVMKMDGRTPQTNETTHNFNSGPSVIPGYYCNVGNTPQCAICGLKHLGICPRASVPCRSCGNLGHSPNYCPVNIYRGYLNIFSSRLGFGYHQRL